MSIKDDIKAAVKEGMKAKQQVKVEALRSLLTEIQYEEIAKGVEDLPAADVAAICQREIKKRNEEIEYADKAGRADTKNAILAQIEAIQAFLPKQMSRAELEAACRAIVSEQQGANVGLVMKALKDRFGGKYDGKLASEVVKTVLG